ncbi:hypothetical protein [Ruminococcus albus]|uniref:Uncharacterized protein n=1 Tax=Ruminococcus albus TaxID=1264 RepID=A0A1I1QZR3_RUMAL|nr:hypothetical protein [Ruminococcus albus]SFD27472.1 hypothetical protein SAMN02910406_03560 [Ruminococcus albus]
MSYMKWIAKNNNQHKGFAGTTGTKSRLLCSHANGNAPQSRP